MGLRARLRFTSGRRRRLLIATATVAVGVPISTAVWVADRTDHLADHLTTVGGVRAPIQQAAPTGTPIANAAVAAAILCSRRNFISG